AVIGAGPAGIAAAVTAAAHGKRVVLVDAAQRAGGQIWRSRADAAPHVDAGTAASPSTSNSAASSSSSRTTALPSTARHWLSRLRLSDVNHLTGAEVISAAQVDGGFVLALERVGPPGTDPVRTVRAARLVIATGARELFLPFPGWTQPGVVGVGGAQALLKAGWDVRGRRAVVAGSGPLLLPVAAALARAGTRVVEVAEQAPRAAVLAFAASLWRNPSRLADAVRYRAAFAGAPYHTGTWVQRAHGDGALERVTLTDGRRQRDVPCDLLCTGFGLTPATELARALGCETRRGAVVVDDEQRTSVAGIFCAGEPTGIAGADAALVQGRIAGLAATGVTAPSGLARRRTAAAHAAARMHDAFALRPELASLAGADTLVCRCEDVRFGEIAECGGAREAKLVTRMAMGACQGRVCGPAVRHLLGWTEDTVRAPLFPARIETLIDYGSDHEEE
ncbi:MAG TPA: FAD-dependent oxidoreductase, partial [Longimicrobiales bacterium]|nr:FAD-dependent oxidoreductase [Longimicrobiales bacterium]